MDSITSKKQSYTDNLNLEEGGEKEKEEKEDRRKILWLGYRNLLYSVRRAHGNRG